MAHMTIRDLDETVIARLQTRASETGRSVEDVARDLLGGASPVSLDTHPSSARAARAALIRRMSPNPPSDDSTALVREDRDRP